MENRIQRAYDTASKHILDGEVIASPGDPDDPESVIIPAKFLCPAVFENAKAENLPMPYTLTLSDGRDEPVFSITLMRTADRKLDFVIQKHYSEDSPLVWPLAIDLEASDGRSLHGRVYMSGKARLQ